ncbi:MAG: hypothetical protein M3264_09280 [Thermoproteota archaeon]|nr:hypothetical protein [Thermoproteota archaeon]
MRGITRWNIAADLEQNNLGVNDIEQERVGVLTAWALAIINTVSCPFIEQADNN